MTPVALHGVAHALLQQISAIVEMLRGCRATPPTPPNRIGAKKSTQTFSVRSFSKTVRVMDVRAENRGRPHQKVGFPAAPVMGRNFLTPGHPGVRVGNVRRKFGPKNVCLCCLFFPDKKTLSHLSCHPTVTMSTSTARSVAGKFPCNNRSRYTGVSQLHSHQSRYTVPLRCEICFRSGQDLYS